MTVPTKKLIEVALPLEAINKASAREKSIRHGHPSTLHLWWARRPLAAARAVIFAQMVDDPSAYVDTLKSDPKLRRKAESILKARHKRWEEATVVLEKARRAGISAPAPGPEPTLDDILAENERQRLFKIIEDLVLWENTTNEEVLERARAEIWQSWRRACAVNAGHPPACAAEQGDAAGRRAKELFDRNKLPAFHDPFAGGGALPLEAQRLGLEAYASDLNPVAVLINKAMIEIPPKFAGRPPVNPEARKKYLGTRASRPPVPEDAGGTPALPDHKEWHSRGYLPHFDHPGLVQSITFRLHDAVPAGQIETWKDELNWRIGLDADDPAVVALRRKIERFEDAGHGACHLRDHRIAALVQDAILHFDGERYRVVAWCIMPNHVHVVIETMGGFRLGDILHSWKSFTAKEANRILGRCGPFWMEDYHDRFIRNDEHLQRAIAYVLNNPVKAGLVAAAEEWRFSSAMGPRASCPQTTENAGGTPALPGMWRGAQGLAEDVRYYGQWMRNEAEKRIGHLYPKIEVTAEMAAGSAGVSPARPDLKPLVGQKLTVIAWLWARTVHSPNPAFIEVEVPLASTFMLSTKPGKEAWVEVVLGARASRPPVEDAAGTAALPGYRFVVKTRACDGAPPAAAKNGTKLARGANFGCVMSGTPIAGAYIKAEGVAGRMGSRLMAIVAAGDRGRVYLSPTPEHEVVAGKARPEWKPDLAMPENPRWFSPPLYGLATYGDLFTPRQLVALTTFSDLVGEAMEKVTADAQAWERGRPARMDGSGQDARAPRGLDDGGTGAKAYAEAVGVYLAFAVSKASDRNSSLCFWESPMNRLRGTFGRQALAMVWDYAETNPFAGAGGDIYGTAHSLCEVLDNFFSDAFARADQQDAQTQSSSADKVVSTDPPYYDNIGYADLSDFFYVWLRRSTKSVFPNLFATLTVPKTEELVATPYRHGGREKAETFFLTGMTQAMHRLAEQSHPAFPVTIYYAFKQAESDGADGTTNTGWDTFLAAVIEAGFAISGTWPMRTELTVALKKAIGALASSIVLVCRPRPADAPTATRREFVAALQRELPEALRHLQAGNIAPVDLAQAAIGPGMAVFTRYAKVLDAQGNALSVREALALINETLDAALAEQEGDFDPDSRWALAWFEQHGFAEGEYGVAETLSKAKNTSVAGMVDAGILASSRGKVRLLKADELSAEWDPATDKRLTAWETVHHLIRVLESGGEPAAAQLAAKLGSKAETARELCYRLYTVCERKKRAAEALSYNGLVQSWPEVMRLSRERASAVPEQGELL